MVNIELLKKTIDDRGITIVKLAQKSNIERATLYNRLNNKGEFTASEIIGLSDALMLSKNERDNIFLVDKVN